MAFVTKLLIDGKEIEVLSYQFGFKKNIDKRSKPVSLVSFNGLEIEIESTENTDFEEWMKSEKPKNKIQLQIFYPYLEGGSKIMTFYDCYLVEFQTIFSNNNSQPMKDRLKITSGGVKTPYSEIEYTTSWRKTFEMKSSNPYTPTVINYEGSNNVDIKLTKITYTDGREISQYFAGDIIEIHFETQNSVGKTVNLNLEDKEYDFKYEGKILKKDTIKNYKIKSKFDKITLEVVKPEKEKS